MRKPIGIFISIILSSCAANISIDPTFSPYVSAWNSIYQNNPVTVSINFADLTADDAVGEWDGIQIWIDQTYWNNTNVNNTRQQLIFHELGHAEFHYGHDFYCISTEDFETVVECYLTFSPSTPPQNYFYIPRSIMYPWVFGEETIFLYYLNYYENQLNNCTTCTSDVNGNGTVSNVQDTKIIN